MAQTTRNDCGAAVLAMLHNDLHGQKLAVTDVLTLLPANAGGWSVADLQDAGAKLGVGIEGYAGTLSELAKAAGNRPAVLVVKREGSSHYVVVQRTKKRWRIYDPALGASQTDRLDDLYEGVYLIVRRTVRSSLKSLTLANGAELSVVYLVALLLLQGVNVAAGIVGAKYLQLVLSLAIEDQTTANLISLSGGFLLVFAVNTLTGVAAGWLKRAEVARCYERTVGALLTALAGKRLSFFSKIERNDLISLDDYALIWVTRNAVGLADAAVDVAVLGVVGVVLGALSYQLLLVALIATGLLTGAGWAVRAWRTGRLSAVKANADEFKRLQLELAESKRRAFDDRQVRRLLAGAKGALARHGGLYGDDALVDGVAGLATGLVKHLFVVASVVVGSLLLAGGGLANVAQITYFVALGGMMAGAAEGVVGWFAGAPAARQAKDVVTRIATLDNAKSQTGAAPDKIPDTVTASGIRFSFGNRTVFEDVSFTLRPSTLVSGPSGSGKSTLARMLTGDNPPTAGGLTFDGVDVGVLDGGWIKERVLLLTNEPVLDEAGLRTVANDADPLVKLLLAAAKVSANALAQNSLSTGQRQLVKLLEVARASDMVLVFDEALANLDPAASELAMLFVVKPLCQRNFVVWISHDQTAADHFPNRLRLEAGHALGD